MSIMDFNSWLTEERRVDDRSNKFLQESIANFTTDINKHFITFDKADSNLFKQIGDKRTQKPYVSTDGVWIINYNGSDQYSIAKLDKISKGEIFYISVKSHPEKLRELFINELQSKSLDDLISHLKSDQTDVSVRSYPIKGSEVLSDYVNPYALVKYVKKLTKGVKLTSGKESKAVARGDLIKILVNSQYDKAFDGSVRTSSDIKDLKPTTIDIFKIIDQLYQHRVVIYTFIEESDIYVSVETQGSAAWAFKLSSEIKVK